MKITVAMGTRPEMIKLAGVVAALRSAGHQVRAVATGQHDDPRLAADILAEVGCTVDATWRLPQGEGARVGGLLAEAFAEFAGHRPDALLVLGDTYTAPIVAMAARRHSVGVIHVEAGLRSFNEQSMEELNRRMMTALASVHLAPTEMAAGFLRAEGVAAERVRVVGNPVIDTLRVHPVRRVPPADRHGTLVTAHRATNVDDPVRLADLVRIVRALGEQLGPVTFPLHPRTRARLDEHGLRAAIEGPGVHLCDPLPYGDLLERLAGSQVVVTDSGGLQEEASWFGVPAVVLRRSTPRWEGVMLGSAVLTGLYVGAVLAEARHFAAPAEQERVAALPCPYGDGHTADRIIEALADPALVGLLRPTEPDFAGAFPHLPAMAAAGVAV